MTYLIQQKLPKLMLFFFILLNTGACVSDTASHIKNLPQKTILIPSGEELKTYIAKSYSEQKKGLSGVKPSDFSVNEAVFFTGNRIYEREFWMINTFFDLDLFFLNEDLYVLDIHRNLQHFEGESPKSEIPRSRIVRAQHVLEVKSSSPLAKKIKLGMILKWKD